MSKAKRGWIVDILKDKDGRYEAVQAFWLSNSPDAQQLARAIAHGLLLIPMPSARIVRVRPESVAS